MSSLTLSPKRNNTSPERENAPSTSDIRLKKRPRLTSYELEDFLVPDIDTKNKELTVYREHIRHLEENLNKIPDISKVSSFIERMKLEISFLRHGKISDDSPIVSEVTLLSGQKARYQAPQLQNDLYDDATKKIESTNKILSSHYPELIKFVLKQGKEWFNQNTNYMMNIAEFSETANKMSPHQVPQLQNPLYDDATKKIGSTDRILSSHYPKLIEFVLKQGKDWFNQNTKYMMSIAEFSETVPAFSNPTEFQKKVENALIDLITDKQSVFNQVYILPNEKYIEKQKKFLTALINIKKATSHVKDQQDIINMMKAETSGERTDKTISYYLKKHFDTNNKNTMTTMNITNNIGSPTKRMYRLAIRGGLRIKEKSHNNP